MPSVLLLVVAPVAFAVTTALQDGDDGNRPASDGAAPLRLPRTGSSVVADAGEGRALVLRRTPQSYDITYRVTSGRGPSTVTATEQLQVSRPFLGRVVSTPPDSTTKSERVTRLGALVLPTGAGARRLAVPPAMAGSDLRFDVSLPAALADGAVEARERRRVAGRRCQVYRFGASVAAGDLTPYDPEGAEWADACIDEEGLLLEELWHKGGRDLRHRVATKVAVDVRLDEAAFTLPGEQAIPVEEGNGLFRSVVAGTSAEGRSWTITPPEGFESVGRFVVQAPRLDLEGTTPLERSAPESFDQMDVWRRGADLLVLSTTIAADFTASAPADGTPVDLGPMGAGMLKVTLRGTTISGPAVDGRTPRVTGTLAAAQLVELLRSATAVEGTGLRFSGEA